MDASAIGWTNTGNTVETTVLTLTGVVPANAMGANGVLKVTTLWSTTANDASVKNGRVRINTILVDIATLTSQRAHQKALLLRNRNNTSLQVTTSEGQVISYGQSAGVVDTYTFDTTLPLDFTFTIQNAAAGDSTTLEAYMIEVLNNP